MKYSWKKWLKWLGIAILIYLIYRIVSNRLEGPKVAPPVVTAGGGTTVPKFVYDPSKVSRTKSFGIGTMNSQEVAYLQTWLNGYYNAGLKVDGDWGAKTSLAFAAHLAGKNPISTTLDNLGI